MMNTFHPSIIFFKSNTLFVSDTILNQRIKQIFPDNGVLKSLSIPCLWEMSIGNTNNETLFLHLDWSDPIGLITLVFQEEQIQFIKDHREEILNIGFLDNFDEQSGNASNAVFITDVGEGLNMVL